MKDFLQRLTRMNWKLIAAFAIAIFYAGLFVIAIRDSQLPIHYGGDYLMVCTGEFVRNTLGKKPILSGVWLAGLLLKPQLLILVVPVLLITRYWKVLLGFIISSGFILSFSVALSGIDGTMALFKLWTGWGESNAITAPMAMINWRMLATFINELTGYSLVGWIVAALGITATVSAVYMIVKHTPHNGGPQWVLGILGVFTATMLVTWHSHHHMALVLIPLLFYVTAKNLLPEIILFLWVILPPLVWVIALIVGQAGIEVNQVVAVSIAGLFTGIMILFFTLKASYFQQPTRNGGFDL